MSQFFHEILFGSLDIFLLANVKTCRLYMGCSLLRKLNSAPALYKMFVAGKQLCDCPLGARVRISPAYENRERASSLNFAIDIQWHCLWTPRLAVQAMRTIPVKARWFSNKTLECIRLYSMARVEKGNKNAHRNINKATIKCQVCQQHWRWMAQINVS